MERLLWTVGCSYVSTGRGRSTSTVTFTMSSTGVDCDVQTKYTHHLGLGLVGFIIFYFYFIFNSFFLRIEKNICSKNIYFFFNIIIIWRNKDNCVDCAVLHWYCVLPCDYSMYLTAAECQFHQTNSSLVLHIYYCLLTPPPPPPPQPPSPPSLDHCAHYTRPHASLFK